MKKIAYVRKKSRTCFFTLDKQRAAWPLSIETDATIAWENSDLGRIIDNLDIDDTLIISDIRDLGRNVIEALEILAAILDSGGILGIVSGGFIINPKNSSGMESRLFLGLVDVEKRRRSERSKAALALRKEAGVTLGSPLGKRKSKLDKHRKQIEEQLVQGVTQKFLAEKYKVTPAALSYWMKKNGIKRLL